jgi:hypothetical protein
MLNIVFETKSKRGFLSVGETYTIKVINNTGSAVAVEGFVHSFKGSKMPLGSRIEVGAGQTLPLDSDTITDATPGKEELVFYACAEKTFPKAVVLKCGDDDRKRGEVIADRVVHPLYELRDGRVVSVCDPTKIVKRTLEIETR